MTGWFSAGREPVGLRYLATGAVVAVAGGLAVLLMQGPVTPAYAHLTGLAALTVFAGFATLLAGSPPDGRLDRVNAAAGWAAAAGGLLAVAGLLTEEPASDFGWFAYEPLPAVAPSPGGHLWSVGRVTLTVALVVAAAVHVAGIGARVGQRRRVSPFAVTALVTAVLVIVLLPLGLDSGARPGNVPDAVVLLPFLGLLAHVLGRARAAGERWSGAPLLWSAAAIATLGAGLVAWAVHLDVARGHELVLGFDVMVAFAAGYQLWPALDPRIGRLQAALTVAGWHLAFLTGLWRGRTGMPQRYRDYLPSSGISTDGPVSFGGSVLLTLSVVAFLVAVALAATRTRQRSLVTGSGVS